MSKRSTSVSAAIGRYKCYRKIVNVLLLLPFPHPSLFESFSLLDGRLNWISASGLLTGAAERGVFVDLTFWSLN
jgi:hypothetical protein